MMQGPRIYSILKVSMEGSCVGLKYGDKSQMDWCVSM